MATIEYLIRDLDYIYQNDGGSFSANHAADTAFDYLPDDMAAGDALYLGLADGFRCIQFNVGTAISAGSVSLVWEYWNGSSWAQIPSLTDNTDALQTTGENTVYWDPIDDWATTTVNGQDAYWVRLRVDSVSSPSEGGAQTSQKVQTDDRNTIYADGGTESDPLTPEEISQADTDWGVCEEIFTRTSNLNVHVARCSVLIGTNAATYWDCSSGGHGTTLLMAYQYVDFGSSVTWIGGTLRAALFSGRQRVSGDGTTVFGLNKLNGTGDLEEFVWGGRIYGFNIEGDHTLVGYIGGFSKVPSSGSVTYSLMRGGSGQYYNAGTFENDIVRRPYVNSNGATERIDDLTFPADPYCYDGGLQLVDARPGGPWSPGYAGNGTEVLEDYTWTRVLHNGAPLEGLDVTIENGNGTQVASFTSNPSGLPDSEVLLTARYYWQDDDGNGQMEDYNPFTVTVGANSDTYATLEMTYDVTAKQDEPIYVPTYDELGMPVGSVVEAGVIYSQDKREGKFVGTSHKVSVTAPAAPTAQVGGSAPSARVGDTDA